MQDADGYRQAEQRLWDEVGISPSERYVRPGALGVDIRVQEVGSGPPVLFLHGGPAAGASWAPVLAGLRDARCLVVDRPGTGLSGSLAVEPGSARATTGDFVAAVLDAMDIDRAHVVASSFGGWIALHAAARDGDRIDRMVQTGCPAFVPGMTLPPLMRIMLASGMRHLIGRLPGSPASIRTMLRHLGHGTSLDRGRIPEAFVQWYVRLQRDTETFRHDVALMSGLGCSFSGVDPSLAAGEGGLLGSIAAPTLFWWGEDDPFGGRGLAEDLVVRLPDADLEMVPGAGHFPWLDEPEHAIKSIRDFLGC